MASVMIDGMNEGTIDLYAPAMHWQTAESYAGLAPGSHTIVVTVLGTRNAASAGTQVVVDAFVVNS
jgi:bacillopeptidase F